MANQSDGCTVMEDKMEKPLSFSGKQSNFLDDFVRNVVLAIFLNRLWSYMLVFNILDFNRQKKR